MVVRHLRDPREQLLEVGQHILECRRPFLIAVEAVVDGQAFDFIVLESEKKVVQ